MNKWLRAELPAIVLWHEGDIYLLKNYCMRNLIFNLSLYLP